MIGILTPILITMSPNQMVQEIRNWEAEQSRKDIDIVIDDSLILLNNTLTEQEDGSYDTPVTEELLQLPSDEDRQGA